MVYMYIVPLVIGRYTSSISFYLKPLLQLTFITPGNWNRLIWTWPLLFTLPIWKSQSKRVKALCLLGINNEYVFYCSGATTPNGAVQTRNPATRGAAAVARSGVAAGVAARAHRVPAVPRALAHTPPRLARPRLPPAIPSTDSCARVSFVGHRRVLNAARLRSVCERPSWTLNCSVRRTELPPPRPLAFQARATRMCRRANSVVDAPT